MNYFDAKYFHILMMVLFLYNLCISIYNPSKKLFKVSLGITSLILLGSGFMLLSRFGIPHQGPYPLWIMVKLGAWLVLAILPPIMIKRLPNAVKKISLFFVILILVAAFLGVYKP